MRSRLEFQKNITLTLNHESLGLSVWSRKAVYRIPTRQRLTLHRNPVFVLPMPKQDQIIHFAVRRFENMR